MKDDSLTKILPPTTWLLMKGPEAKRGTKIHKPDGRIRLLKTGQNLMIENIQNEIKYFKSIA